MAAVLTSAGSFVVKNAVICKEGRSMRHLFFSEGHLSGRAEVPSEDSGQSLESLGWPGAAFVGNFRFAILQMAAVLTTKSFFVVKSVTIRNGAIRSALADARRCSPTFVAGRDACHGAR